MGVLEVMSARMEKLVNSLVFVIALFVLSAATCGAAAGWFATRFGLAAGLVTIGFAGLVVLVVEFGKSLEMYLPFGLTLIIAALLSRKLSLWWFWIPGAFIGLWVPSAVQGFIVRSNRHAAPSKGARRRKHY